jgi:hypothetical protein
MEPAPLLTRPETLSRLPAFGAALADAVKDCGLAEDERQPMLRASVSAQCSQCGITVTGEELVALTAPSAAGEMNPKLERLREGYCARDGCASYHYQLQFKPYPGVDWGRLLATAEAKMPQHGATGAAERESEAAAKRRERRQVATRVLLGLGIILLLLLIRQWYVGGTVPLIREPEHFQVDHLAP